MATAVAGARPAVRSSARGTLLWVLRRVGVALVTVGIATVVVFLGVRALPGDPVTVLAGQAMGTLTEQELAELREHYGLGQPLVVQYFSYITRMLSGDFGVSVETGAPVSTMIAQRLPVTLELALLSLALGVLVGVGAGIVAAVRHGRSGDYVMSMVGLIGVSIPAFWLGLILTLVFAVQLRWLPASGFVPLTVDPIANLRGMVLPIIALSAGVAASYMRQTRSAMIGVLQSDFIRTARAKGLLPGQVTMRHAARNSMLTVLTLTGLQLGSLISGAVVIEYIFAIPGLGKMMLDGVMNRDYAVVQGCAIVTVLGYVLITFAVDLLYVVVDPRIRIAGGAG